MAALVADSEAGAKGGRLNRREPNSQQERSTVAGMSTIACGPAPWHRAIAVRAEYVTSPSICGRQYALRARHRSDCRPQRTTRTVVNSSSSST